MKNKITVASSVGMLALSSIMFNNNSKNEVVGKVPAPKNLHTISDSATLKSVKENVPNKSAKYQILTDSKSLQNFSKPNGNNLLGNKNQVVMPSIQLRKAEFVNVNIPAFDFNAEQQRERPPSPTLAPASPTPYSVALPPTIAPTPLPFYRLSDHLEQSNGSCPSGQVGTVVNYRTYEIWTNTLTQERRNYSEWKLGSRNCGYLAFSSYKYETRTDQCSNNLMKGTTYWRKPYNHYNVVNPYPANIASSFIKYTGGWERYSENCAYYLQYKTSSGSASCGAGYTGTRYYTYYYRKWSYESTYTHYDTSVSGTCVAIPVPVPSP